MTDTELIEALKKNEYDTELIVVDTEGNEYEVKEVSLTMGGQFHQVIKLERYSKDDNWFRTHEQTINDLEKKIAYYESEEFEKNCMKQQDGIKLLTYYREKEIPHLKYCIDYYNKKHAEKNKEK